MSEAAETYARLWAELDAEFDAGLGQGEKADEIRDRMEEPWYAMTDEEQQAFRDSFDTIPKPDEVSSAPAPHPTSPAPP